MQEGREGIRIPSELGSVGVGGEGCAAASATDDHEEGHTFHPATEERRDTEKRLVRRMSDPLFQRYFPNRLNRSSERHTMPKKHEGPPVETESYLNKWADQKVS